MPSTTGSPLGGKEAASSSLVRYCLVEGVQECNLFLVVSKLFFFCKFNRYLITTACGQNSKYSPIKKKFQVSHNP